MQYKFSDISAMQLVIDTKDGKRQALQLTPFLRLLLIKQLYIQNDAETGEFVIPSDKELNDIYKLIDKKK